MASLVILLHGVGARGADLAPLGEAWRDALPDAEFVSPDAPDAFDQADFGRQWFSLRDISAANRPGRVVAARHAFDQLIGRIIADHGQPDRVALAGFSQGAIMALDAVADGRWPVAGVIGYSGRLASPDPLTPARQTPVLLVHGDADLAIPFQESESVAKRLRQAGVDVEYSLQPGVGHAISPEGAALGASFLARVLTQRSGNATS